MFHTWLVKIAKIEAASSPNRLPRKSAMKNVMVTDRKPSTGTLCSTSSRGMSTRSARRLWAATYP
jgi:hypothetical protein